jgi:hypothetical protein
MPDNKNVDIGKLFVGRAALSLLGLGSEIIQDNNHKRIGKFIKILLCRMTRTTRLA